MTAEIADAVVVDDEPGMELVHAPQAHEVNLWRATEPADVIAEASRLADAYKDVVKQKGLIATIRGREHPQVEAWQLLGSMLGVHPVPVGEPVPLPWPDPIPSALKAFHDRGLTFGFTASYLAVKNGETVGGGQSRCMRSENTWKDRDDFALASMAQTRAISKALSGPLRFVMVLAGYQATPAEEMPADALTPVESPLAKPFDPSLAAAVGAACTHLAGGNKTLGQTLYRSVKQECGGFVPHAAAVAIIQCAELGSLEPAVDVPEVS